MNDSSFLEKVKDRYPQIVFEGPSDLDICSTDFSVVSGQCDAVIIPTELRQVSEVVKLANEVEILLTVRGGGTSMTGASVPTTGIVLDLSAFDFIKLTGSSVEVGSGVILSELNDCLALSDRFFPVTPASLMAATIGGMYSTNAIGMRGMRYGRMSDWVREIEFVDGTGKTRVIDDDDEIKRLSGKEGTFGIVTRLILDTIKINKDISYDILEFDSIVELISKISELQDDKNVAMLEFMCPICCEYSKISPSNYRLIIEYSDYSRGSVKAIEKGKVWKSRVGLGSVLTAAGFMLLDDPYVTKIDQKENLLNWFRKHKIPVFGHIGYGIFHPRFRTDQEDLLREMLDFVVKIGGNVTGEHGYGTAKSEYMPEDVRAEFIKIKKKYDPDGVFRSIG
ncbi:FAD-binding oxidoreductase [Candidatus Dojkabacteria bacterium]|nr:FAD-binding oxidoreductase [Candidatus Dojkabacteria bacterium]